MTTGNDGAPRQLRVLQLIANLDIGGAQEVVRTLAPALAAAGADVRVATFRDGPLRADLEAAGVPVVVLPGRRRRVAGDPRAAAELWRLRSRLRRWVRDEGFDVVQTHLLRALDLLVLGVRREGRPIVAWTFHNARLELRGDQVPGGPAALAVKRALYRAAYRLGARRVDAVVAVSPDVATAVRRLMSPPPGRLATIPNAVDLERFARPVDRAAVRRASGLPAEATVAICVAKFLEQKGHRHLVDALALAAAEAPDLHVAFVGSGPLEAEIAGRARERGVADRITALGARRDVPELLAASDIFVLPSLWEGLPMALLEGMAAGLPALATRVSGVRDVIDSPDAGLVVEPAVPEALADGLVRLARDPELRRRTGTAGRERVRAAYGAEAQAGAHLALFREALARTARAAA